MVGVNLCCCKPTTPVARRLQLDALNVDVRSRTMGDCDLLRRYDSELLQTQRMFRVMDGSNEVCSRSSRARYRKERDAPKTS